MWTLFLLSKQCGGVFICRKPTCLLVGSSDNPNRTTCPRWGSRRSSLNLGLWSRLDFPCPCRRLSHLFLLVWLRCPQHCHILPWACCPRCFHRHLEYPTSTRLSRRMSTIRSCWQRWRRRFLPHRHRPIVWTRCTRSTNSRSLLLCTLWDFC